MCNPRRLVVTSLALPGRQQTLPSIRLTGLFPNALADLKPMLPVAIGTGLFFL